MADGVVSNLTLLGSTFVIYGGDLSEYSKTEDDKYSQHSILDEFINNDTITFAFVRDPVDRFLSAFYEAHYRELKAEDFRSGMKGRGRGKSGIETVRLWIGEILLRMDMEREVLLNRSANARGRRRRLPWTPIVDGTPYINSHLVPNMRFLVGQHYKTSIPFNFIGDLKHFAEDFPQIIEPFILDEEMKRNHSKLMELMEHKKVRTNDNWDFELNKYHIERAELSDEDVVRICDMYWLEYMCLPFELPEPCDVNKLIEEHYGVDVEYTSCY